MSNNAYYVTFDSDRTQVIKHHAPCKVCGEQNVDFALCTQCKGHVCFEHRIKKLYREYKGIKYYYHMCPKCDMMNAVRNKYKDDPNGMD